MGDWPIANSLNYTAAMLRLQIKDKLFVLYDEVYFTALVSSNLSLPRAKGAILPISCGADALATVSPSSLTLTRPVDLAPTQGANRLSRSVSRPHSSTYEET